MPGSSIWDQLEIAFNESAIANDETDEKQLVSPGTAGLQEMIEGVLGSGKITSEDLETFYAKADWDQEHSLNLADFRSIVSSLNLPALQDEDGTPVDDEEDEEVDGDANAKLNASDSSEPSVIAKQLTDVYDKIKESFDEQNFKHSFNDETFVPLIPPQTIPDTGKRENAVKAYQLVTPNLLPRVNKQLWSDWHEEQEVAGMLGEDVETNQHTSFQNFVETNYVKTILEIAGEAAKQEPKFTPKVAPDVGASPEVHEQRVELLSKAQVTDHKEAERKVKELYVRFVKSKRPDIQRRLPSDPPENFWVKNYYECLKEAVENRQSSSNVASPVAKKSRSADAGYIENKTSHTADGSRSREVGAVGVQSLTTTQNVSLSGIDELLSGQGFSSDPVVPEVLHFMSAADILQTNNEHTRCKFQGALVHIDSQPRSLQREPQSSSSRKRDAGLCALLSI